MSGLSLRSRLLAGLTIVAITLATVAWIVTTSTRSDLVGQIDDQLVATFDPVRVRGLPRPGEPLELPGATPPGVPERLSAMYEGIIHPDTGLTTIFEPNLPGQNFSPPDIDWEMAADQPAPFTAGSVDDSIEYRVLATAADDFVMVRALPLTDVNDATGRLLAVQVIGLGATFAVLAAVGWWVIRLGIAPINAMTDAATSFTDEDLSVRLPEPAEAGTEAGRLARTLNGMLGRLERAVTDQRASEDRLRQFVADASHELRTPVTTIAGYADLYNTGGLRDDASLDDAMRRTEQEAHRMGRLVNDMLTLAKHDEQRPLDCATVDLSGLLLDIVADARAAQPGHVHVAEIAADLELSADRDRLHQALANIVSNAAVHTPAGTTITVSASRTDDGDIGVRVADDGPGIDAEHVGRLTERFYRADASRSRASGGSGLGLAITLAAIEAHGGTLDVRSQPDEGTVVTVVLPTSRPGV